MKEINNLKRYYGLRFGIFTICASILFAFMMYFIPTVVPSLKIFSFPLVVCLAGIFIIFDSIGKSYIIAYKLLALLIILLPISFVLIFDNIPWQVYIILLLFVIVGLIALFQRFSLKRGY
jgi:hypothetical protein